MYRYSNRLSWDADQNEFSRCLAEQMQAGHQPLDLTSSNPTACFEEYPQTAIHDAFCGIDDFSYEPDPFGSLQARREIVRYYARRGIPVTENQILLTASTSEAYALLFKLFCDPGDEVLVPTPSYPLFEYLAALESVTAAPYGLRYDGSWYVDFDSLRARLSGRSKALVIVNPNNPTGTFLTLRERDTLLEIAATRQLPLICDEVFMDYANGSRGELASTLIGCDAVLSFSLNGLSKAGGMPQMKLAWVVINGPAAEVEAARARLEILSDTYLSVATPVQRALSRLLPIAEEFQLVVRQRLSENLTQIDHLLQTTAAHRLQMDGGWSAILRVPKTRTEEEWISSLLREYAVIVQPGYYFELPPDAYFVVSLLTPPERLREGLLRIKTHLSNP